MSRPLILIPARFSASAAALRFGAEVTARKLAEAVYTARAEPLTVHPHLPGGTILDNERVGSRFGFIDGVLLPSGGDISHRFYDGQPHASLYDVDEEQDLFDFSVARWAQATGRPVLAICRGLQVVNVDRGGTWTRTCPSPTATWSATWSSAPVLLSAMRPARRASGPAASIIRHSTGWARARASVRMPRTAR